MWSTSLASFKENLNKIAQDVHDDDDEYEDSSIYNSNDRNDSPVSNRRFSDRSFSNSYSNGFDSAHDSEVYMNTYLSTFVYLFSNCVYVKCYVCEFRVSVLS